MVEGLGGLGLRVLKLQGFWGIDCLGVGCVGRKQLERCSTEQTRLAS